MNIQLDQVTGLSIATLSQQSVRDLHRLYQHVLLALGHAKAQKTALDHALNRKYFTQAQARLQQQGKDTGTVHLSDERFDIKVNVPKKVEWDQSQLAAVCQSLRHQGQDPSRYIQLKYSVHERDFQQLPPDIKVPVENARVLNVGKPTITLNPCY